MAGIPKVSREGIVTVDGVTIGRVVRTHGETVASVLLGTEGPVVWKAVSADGNELTAREYETRKRAVAVVVEAAQPTTVGKIHQGTDMMTGRAYLACSLMHKGSYFGLSRYPGESGWVVDYLHPLGQIMPTWSNGEGTRVTAAYVIKDAELVKLIDEAVSEYAGQKETTA